MTRKLDYQPYLFCGSEVQSIIKREGGGKREWTDALVPETFPHGVQVSSVSGGQLPPGLLSSDATGQRWDLINWGS